MLGTIVPRTVMENGDCALQPPTDSSNFSTIHWRSDANITHMNKALQSFSVLLFFYCFFVCDNHPVPTTTSADTCPTIQKLTPLCKVGSFTKSVVTVVCKTCHRGLSSLCNISYMHQLNEPATLQGEQGTYIHQLWITHPMDNISWMHWATSGVNELHHFTSHSSHCTVEELLGGLITPRQQGQRSKVKDGQATLGYSQGRRCVCWVEEVRTASMTPCMPGLWRQTFLTGNMPHKGTMNTLNWFDAPCLCELWYNPPLPGLFWVNRDRCSPDSSPSQ